MKLIKEMIRDLKGLFLFLIVQFLYIITLELLHYINITALKYTIISSTIPVVIIYFLIFKKHLISKYNGLFQLVSYFLLILVIISHFGQVFEILYEADKRSFKIDYPTSNTHIDFFYFSTTTIATVGFGDTLPVTITAKILTTIEIITGIILLIFIFSNFKLVFKRQETQNPVEGGSS